ncbi:molybdate ABC transporter substrate-binding protein [Dissulfurirhabdus thermomarina]|uniref:Molybdate ABC transporter substrate-binding protein n=1 Tax=Dissulfurirhabdus thermomarina TaxID=1765737 RepID=A0A6N9TPY1_DISTH|nr:molybdate ABC transporter substrate-binding protein [Dissulfurirhabdus thermomarina]NDY42490.1 molybdate ABC transporter substrate-binding protein [Dissulfurirhabdus thermomarina]NMX22873.1 molybdate ABC transporter substrate-binding protein [Dissulfurirhabdus thermomarina]
MDRRTAICALLALGLSVSAAGRAAAAEFVVAAAASLSDAFRAEARAFEAAHPGDRVVLDLASSGTLYVQIEQGAPVDVYASASHRYMDRLERAGRLLPGTRADFAANRIVLVVPAGASRVATPRDLLRPEVRRVAVGDPAHVPAGRYAREALEGLGLWPRLQGRLVLGVSVRQVRDYVARGEVDAGVVFATDARVPGLRVVHVFADGLHAPIRYPAAVLKDAAHPAAGRAFVAFLRSGEGRAILERFGFGAVPGEPRP